MNPPKQWMTMGGFNQLTELTKYIKSPGVHLKCTTPSKKGFLKFFCSSKIHINVAMNLQKTKNKGG